MIDLVLLAALVRGEVAPEPVSSAPAGSQPASCAASDGEEVLLFTSFRGNGEDGLYLAWSEDGFTWRPLNGDRPVLRPQVGPAPLMRDPCLARGPDGRYHLVWTTSWGRPPLIGYASSEDLRRWSPQRALSPMDHEPQTLNVWAPELFWDRASGRFLLLWSSTVPGRFPETAGSGEGQSNHRIYFTATRDFEHFEPTRLLFDGGFNCIDATLLELPGRFALIVKDETAFPPRKHLRMVFGDSPTGPWTGLTAPFTRSWVEGPSAVRIGEFIYVYFDHYVEPQHYGAVRSRDLQTWEDVSDRMRFPPGHRHGTVLRVPRSLVQALDAPDR